MKRQNWFRALRPLPAALALVSLAALYGGSALAQPDRQLSDQEQDDADWIRAHYTKRELRIPMRDGVRLLTSVYLPNEVFLPGDGSKTFPILLLRTPYSVRPYGEDAYRDSLGPSRLFIREGYIFVYQDVRGAYMSEGEFVNMRPHRERKRSPQDVDESTDTYDTIDWLVKNLPGNNGKVGMWGISYPGFYTAAGMIDSHPALKACSPQAPIADWFFDDFHHHGAFFLPHTFNFFASFGLPRPKPTTERHERFDHGTPDGYQFFLDLGSLKNADERYLKGEVAFWKEITGHPDYDEFWQERNLLPHLSGVGCAVLTVGGWFDAEDLYGPLHIYRKLEADNPGIASSLVMGPWRHGGWSRTDGASLGHAQFGFPTSAGFQEGVELPFFDHYLKGGPDPKVPEAWVFETGANRWRGFDAWPPAGLKTEHLYPGAQGALRWTPPPEDETFDEYVSDPAHPVPFTQAVDPGMTREYMTDDQRFASRRPDVLSYKTEPLDEPLTLAGPIQVELWVSTDAGDADWVVKLIDVHPPDAPDLEAGSGEPFPVPFRRGGYQMMVRSEVFRGRFRESYEHPLPFEPGQPTRVAFPLQDVLHTFQRGHRLMVQVQSSWFPLVDRNPQKWVPNIFEAADEDFVKATHRLYRGGEHRTVLTVGVLPQGTP